METTTTMSKQRFMSKPSALLPRLFFKLKSRWFPSRPEKNNTMWTCNGQILIFQTERWPLKWLSLDYFWISFFRQRNQCTLLFLWVIYCIKLFEPQETTKLVYLLAFSLAQASFSKRTPSNSSLQRRKVDCFLPHHRQKSIITQCNKTFSVAVEIFMRMNTVKHSSRPTSNLTIVNVGKEKKEKTEQSKKFEAIVFRGKCAVAKVGKLSSWPLPQKRK